MRKLYIFGLIALAGIIIGFAWAEQITMTTYYPAPYGVYQQLQATVVRLQPSDGPPALVAGSEEEGMIFFDTGVANPADRGLRYYDGASASWEAVGGETSLFGAWQADDSGQVGGAGAPLAPFVVYQAATDGFVLAYGYMRDIIGYTDSAGATTMRTRDQAGQAAELYCNIMMPVRNGDSWQVTTSAADGVISAIYWIPLGM